ncbi:hypothetical protein GCM10011313_23960 [Mycetocola zhadangensis]|nr:hypothetical protein GCM10011313_23960 [Mycetocola zhadangensis]
MAVYRARTALIAVSALLIFAGTVLGLLLPDSPLDVAARLLPVVGVVGMLVAFGAGLLGTKSLPEHRTLTVTSPVVGRWMGMNSPTSKVPSHGIRAYGQAYAIDLVAEPPGVDRPAFGSGAAFRRPEEYPAFGQPVRAMIDGVVVKASTSQPDHRARSTWPSVIYLMLEGMIRELGGPRFILGNHVTIRGNDGVYALVAHLKQASLLVSVGDTVRAGQVIADCGNSGNTSEPHVHAQLMDRASVWTAQGLPMAFADVALGDEAEPENGLPSNDQHMIVA